MEFNQIIFLIKTKEKTMKYFLKQFVRRMFNSAGFHVSKSKKAGYDQLYYKLFSHDSINNKRFYNIGEAQTFHPFWTLVDLSIQKTQLGRINYDLMSKEPLPIDSSSAEIIYSSQVIEHITDDAANYMFKESFRCLKKGGFLRLVTPDIDLAYRALKHNDWDFLRGNKSYETKQKYLNVNMNKHPDKASIEQLFLWRFARHTSTMFNLGDQERIDDKELNNIFSELEYEEALNYCISKCSKEIQRKYSGGHINWWNKSKVTQMLQQAGFTEIYLSGYGQSFNPVLRNINFFDKSHPEFSLYVEV